MRTWIGRVRWLALGLILPLALTGCFKSAGEDLPPTQPGGVVMVSNQNTQEPPINTPVTVEPTDIIAPTAEEVTAFPTPIPTLSPFPTMPSETETPQAGQGGPLGPTATRTAQAVVIAPTFTPPLTSVVVIIQPTSTPQPTFTTQPTYTPLPTYTTQPTYTQPPAVVAQVPTITPLPTNTQPPVYTRVAPQTSGVGPTMTFTPVPFMRFQPSPTYTPYAVAAAAQPGQPQFVQPVGPTQPQEAIPMVEQPTLAPGGQGGPVFVETPPAVAQVATLTPYYIEPTQPVIPQGPTLTGGQMTATQIVYGATATMAYLMGTQLPPPTPYGGEVQPGVAQPQIIQPGQYPPNATLITATPYGQIGMCAEHRISIGETLYRIAARYGVTAQAIATANNIVNPDLIEAGKTLQIPCPAAPTLTPVGVVQPSTGVTTTTSGQQIYVVQAGDNIYRISLKFGVDMGELVRLNGLNEITMNSIYVGQELIIPATTIIATPIPGALPTLTPYNIVVTPIPGTTG